MSGARTVDPAPPDWLFEVLGGRLIDPARLPWGFTNESWAATVLDRRLVATRMAEPGAARLLLDRGPEVARRLAAVGVPAAMPIEAALSPALGVVVSELIDGTPGIELSGRAGGARLLGKLAGRTWLRMRGADPTGLGLDDLWSRPADLLASASGWLAATAVDLPDAMRAVLRVALDRVAPALIGRPAALVHGDFVPVNLLVRDDRVVGLLDLEAVRVGEPMLDAAWFEWILRHHHPEIADEAATALAREAGLDREDAATATLLSVLPAIRILEILDRAELPAVNRRQWLEQLRQLAGSLGR